MLRAIRRFAPVLLLAMPALEAACFGDGPCEGDCPPPWSVRYDASGKTSFNLGQFIVEVTADGVHGSSSCSTQGPAVSCTGTAGDFQVLSLPCNNGGCGSGFIVASAGSYPTQVRITISSSKGQNDDATLTMSYSTPSDSCSCKSAQAIPGRSL